MTKIETKISELFEELVPRFGKADTVAGEIIRAIERIDSRCWVYGEHIGVDYGCHTCNAAARFLQRHCNEKIDRIISDMWGLSSYVESKNALYEDLLEELKAEVLAFVEDNPHLKQAKNAYDMFDYYYAPEDDEFDDEEVEL